MCTLPRKKTDGHRPHCQCADCKRKYELNKAGPEISRQLVEAGRIGDFKKADQLSAQLEEINSERASL